jgi:urease accessory protein
VTQRRALPAAAATLLLLSCTGVQAHLASTGMGPVYDGISHLFLSVDDLLPVIAMALLAGLHGPATARWVLFLLPVSWLVGGIVGFTGLTGAAAGAPAGMTSLSLLLPGILVAADRRLPLPVVASLALTLGLFHGALNGAGIALAGREASGLAGIAGAVFVLTALVSALVVSLRRPSMRIVVRVAGSWVAAIGLLLAGWSLGGRV